MSADTTVEGAEDALLDHPWSVPMALRMMLVVEMESVTTEGKAQAKLDRYREIMSNTDAFEPGEVTISRATHHDVRESTLFEEVNRCGPIRPVFIKPWFTG
jgi:hypothetical protein